MWRAAEPDGYTILLATNAYSVNFGLYSKLPYDPYKDFVGVCELASSPNTFVVAPNCRQRPIKEFVALAKANPEKFNVATPPVGTAPHIQAEVLKVAREHAEARDHRVQGRRRRAAGAAQRHRAALLRLAAAGASAHQGRHAALPCGHRRQRWPDLPDVPTMEQEGYKDFVFATDTVLLAPAKTPPDIVKWLEPRH